MNQKINELVFLTERGNKATNSQLIAQGFEREHRHVLRLIDDLIFELNNASKLGHVRESGCYVTHKLFYEQKWLDQSNRWQRNFVVSEAGFRLVAMRMSGKRALQFQIAFLEEFDRLTLENQQLKQQVSAAQATEEVARLAQYTSIPKQISCVKEVASTLMRHTRAPFAVINHHRQVMKALTGERPSEYVSQAVKAGHKVRGKSGRAVLRQLEPAKAATAAVLDDAIQQGKSLQEIERAGIVLALPRAFEAILQLGLNPADLQADRAA